MIRVDGNGFPELWIVYGGGFGCDDRASHGVRRVDEGYCRRHQKVVLRIGAVEMPAGVDRHIEVQRHGLAGTDAGPLGTDGGLNDAEVDRLVVCGRSGGAVGGVMPLGGRQDGVI